MDMLWKHSFYKTPILGWSIPNSAYSSMLIKRSVSRDFVTSLSFLACVERSTVCVSVVPGRCCHLQPRNLTDVHCTVLHELRWFGWVGGRGVDTRLLRLHLLRWPIGLRPENIKRQEWMTLDRRSAPSGGREGIQRGRPLSVYLLVRCWKFETTAERLTFFKKIFVLSPQLISLFSVAELHTSELPYKLVMR